MRNSGNSMNSEENPLYEVLVRQFHRHPVLNNNARLHDDGTKLLTGGKGGGSSVPGGGGSDQAGGGGVSTRARDQHSLGGGGGGGTAAGGVSGRGGFKGTSSYNFNIPT